MWRHRSPTEPTSTEAEKIRCMGTMYRVAFLFAAVVAVAVGQNLTQGEASCEAFSKNNRIGKLSEAVMIGECSVSCTFLQYYDQDGGQGGASYGDNAPGAGGGGGDGGGGSGPDNSVDPAMDLSQNGGGTVEITVPVAMSGLEECDTDKVCVSGKCTDVKTENVADCVANVGMGAVAVESTKKCFVKCLRVVNNYNRRPYGGTEGEKELLILNLVKPDTAPCGANKLCNSGYCMSKDLFSAKCS